VLRTSVADIALVELLDGGTQAPPEIIAALRAGDYLEAGDGPPRLTPRGRRRAERLKPASHDLRLLHQMSADGRPLRTDGRATIYLDGGGPVTIRP
jgi:hypothetical protein